jgi:hypothetical protein
VAANFAAASSDSCRETAANGGDSGRFRPIPWARRTREARRCWGRARRRSGRRLAAALAGGHGGELGYWEEDGEERESESSEREKEEGEVAWRAGAAPGGVFSAFNGKQEVALRRPCTGHAGVLPTGRRKEVLQKTP